MLLSLILLPLLGAILVSLAGSLADYAPVYKAVASTAASKGPNRRSLALGLQLRLSLVFSAATFVLSLLIWHQYDPVSSVQFQLPFSLGAGNNHDLGFFSRAVVLGIDGISLWLVLLTAFLFPIAILSSPAHICAWLLVLESALLACWCVLDLLGFFIVYESILIPMFLMIAVGTPRGLYTNLSGSFRRQSLGDSTYLPTRFSAAFLLVVYTLFGSLLWLPCILITAVITGTTNIELLYCMASNAWSLETSNFLWWGFFLAGVVKVPLLPWHLWLPEAHVEAPTAGSVLLAGVILKLGPYLFLRFCLPLHPAASFAAGPIVFSLGLVSLLYASVTTLHQNDLKKVVAYSSIAHMSVVCLALFSGTALGIVSGSFMMIAHGIVSPLLFLAVGSLYSRYHSKHFRYLSGLGAAMPFWSFFFIIASFANMALPLSPNFIGEVSMIAAIFSKNSFVAIITCASMVPCAIYMLWAISKIVCGMPNFAYVSSVADLSRKEFFLMAPLAVCTVLLGVFPSIVLDSIANSAMYTHAILISNL